MRKLVVLTGAGMSAESGLATFRDSGGLWEGHRVEEVATPEAWNRDREKVLTFYNQRRKSAMAASPNEGHLIISELQSYFDVSVITQNVDDLHERAGSRKVLHLHGSLFESRSTLDPDLVYPIKGWELNVGDKCEKGSQLRPNIVWFGEAVSMIEPAAKMVASADYLLVVGTSMVVYPAAGLVDYAHQAVPKFVVDPNPPTLSHLVNTTIVARKASEGLCEVRALLLNAT